MQPRPQPPAPDAPAPTPPVAAPRPAANVAAPNTTKTLDAPEEYRARRAEMAGTHLAGAEGLAEPGKEQPRLRLMAGKVVPGTRYRILRWLGEGGMGVVYEAEHIDIERKVALKILRFDLSQEAKMAQVFRDEARAASRIGSENIVEIYDFGELRDGRLFFCMELLPGKDLVPASEEDWTEPPVLIGLLRQICKGLGQAHKHGIVHRDIKPENIILVHRDGRDVVKVVDFGISAMLAAHDDENTTIAGTPHYMAPEQITGKRFDGRLDMYAVGCMAYELLVGHPPFIAEEIEDLLRQQLTDTPPPMRQLRPDRDIPEALEAVIMRCLEKDPQNRYVDMADLEAALCEAQIAAGLHTPWDDLALPDVDPERREFLLQQMPSPLSEIGPPPKKRWLWPSVAGGAVLVAGVAVAFALFGGKPNEQQQNEVEQLTIAARNAAALTHYVYPPADTPDAPTAYRKVRTLEDLQGNVASLGDKRGDELRQEFAGTLVTLGDRFWEHPDTRNFSRDYYIQALLFDGDNERALERSGMTPGMLADFRERAQSGEFTDAELSAARWLTLLAANDEAELAERVEEFNFDDDESLMLRGAGLRAAKRAGVDIDKVAKKRGGNADPAVGENPEGDGDGAEANGGAGAGTGAEAGADGGEGGTEGDLVVGEEGEQDGGDARKGGRKGGKGASYGKSKRDPTRSRELADEGMSALKSGRRGEAERLFNQAISFDRKNAKALMGLSQIAFDTGKNQQAVIYAEKAVDASPRSSSYRLNLGDAYYKVLRYRDALKEYEKAKELGSSRAEARIAKVKAKIG